MRGRLAALIILVASLAAAGVPAAAAAASGHPRRAAHARWSPIHHTVALDGPRPGRLRPYHASPQETANWSGYVATGGVYTAVTAEWVVPSVVASNQSEASATWIGIDGNTDNDLIQTGTEQDTSNGQTTYYAWYELLPAPETEIGLVSPGDQMEASITQVSAGNWSISITDLTSGQTASGAGAYAGPLSSAEWIEEAPTDQYGNVTTLADFGTMQFTSIGATTSSGTSSLQPLSMVDSGGQVIAYPSALGPGQTSFSDTFGSPSNGTTTTTPTSPPPTQQTTTTVPVVTCPTRQNASLAGAPIAIAAMRASDGCEGYWIASASGAVASFGAAIPHGGAAAGPAPVIDIIATPSGNGYWLVTTTGAVDAFGDAVQYGDMREQHLNGQIVAMAATPDGGGYWLVGSDGGIFSFGDARFFGSTGAMKLNKPVVGIAPVAGGTGYWLVASDGGIFAFGAPFLGSMGGTPLNSPVAGITADPAGRGYRMVAGDGGIFSFGAPFFGSLGASPPPSPISTMAPTKDGNGYYLLATDGSVFSFGDASYLGRTL